MCELFFFQNLHEEKHSKLEKKEDEYHYTKIILSAGNTDIYQQTFERNYGKEPLLCFTILDIIKDNNLGRSKYRELIKKVNSDLSFRNLSSLHRNELRSQIELLM